MMGNIKIGQPMPSSTIEQISPFILLHHGAPKVVQPGSPGIDVAPHPHRGFEPVSFIFKGEVEHHDSMGNINVVKDGGVQWLTAGSGMMHSEGPSREFQENGGEFEMIQLWINLPSHLKMTPPNYQAYDRENIPFMQENGVRTNVVSGSFQGLKGPINSLTEVTALTMEFDAGGKTEFALPENQNLLVYHLHGDASVNGTRLSDQQLVEFEQGGSGITIEASEESLFLVLAGRPIEEPMAQYGPFVMNTQTEILHALRDHEMGKMGFLPA